MRLLLIFRDETLYKIGINKQPIAERLIEIRRDLHQHYRTVEINVLGTWEHRRNVELYRHLIWLTRFEPYIVIVVESSI